MLSRRPPNSYRPLPADNAYRVLVASDAVGMGLNLNIRRIIFHTMAKREGERRLAFGWGRSGAL